MLGRQRNRKKKITIQLVNKYVSDHEKADKSLFQVIISYLTVIKNNKVVSFILSNKLYTLVVLILLLASSLAVIGGNIILFTSTFGSMKLLQNIFLPSVYLQENVELSHIVFRTLVPPLYVATTPRAMKNRTLEELNNCLDTLLPSDDCFDLHKSVLKLFETHKASLDSIYNLVRTDNNVSRDLKQGWVLLTRELSTSLVEQNVTLVITYNRTYRRADERLNGISMITYTSRGDYVKDLLVDKQLTSLSHVTDIFCQLYEDSFEMFTFFLFFKRLLNSFRSIGICKHIKTENLTIQPFSSSTYDSTIITSWAKRKLILFFNAKVEKNHNAYYPRTSEDAEYLRIIVPDNVLSISIQVKNHSTGIIKYAQEHPIVLPVILSTIAVIITNIAVFLAISYVIYKVLFMKKKLA